MAATNLRWYQERDVGRLRQSFRNGKRRIMYQLATGGGKTFTFCFIANGAQGFGRRVMILVHRKELLTQASLSLAKIGLKHTLIAQDKHIREAMSLHIEELSHSFIDLSSRVAIASVDTLINRLSGTSAPDLIIPDEGHHVVPGNKWGRVIEYYGQAHMLAVTATPVRTDGKGLGVDHGGYFEELICGPSMKDLIAEGFLLQPKVYAPLGRLDMTGAGTDSKGEWNKKDAAAKADKPTITGSAVETYARVCKGVPAIAFCTSIEHAQHVATKFRSSGFDFRVIDGTMHDSERRNLIRALARGIIQGLSACDIISEGTDIPVVGCGIMLRPTKSEGLYLQQGGRILRPSPGQEHAFLLDHVGNCFIHGLPEADREWSLDGRVKKKGKKKDAEQGPDILQCPSCYITHDPAPECPECGHEYANGGARVVKEVAGRIDEVTGEAAAFLSRQRKTEEKNCKSAADFEKLAKERGYENPKGWAKLRMKKKEELINRFSPPPLMEPPPYIRL